MPYGNGRSKDTRPPFICKNVAIITVLGRTRIIFWSILFGCATIFAGCGDPVTAAPKKPLKSFPPLVAAAFLDQSQSMTEVATPPLTPADLMAILTYIRAHGGDFGLGPIRRDSNLPLARMHADLPEPKPTAPDESSIYVAAEEDVDYRKQREAWEKNEADRLRRADLSTADFWKKATPILAHKANATRTDLNGAIERARMFLNEPRIFGGVKPLRVAILKTDGVDTLKKTIVAKPLDADVIVIVVNDTPGVLPTLHPIAFEAFSAATMWLCAKAQGGR